MKSRLKTKSRFIFVCYLCALQFDVFIISQQGRVLLLLLLYYAQQRRINVVSFQVSAKRWWIYFRYDYE